MKNDEGRTYDRKLLAVAIPAAIILFPFAYSIGAWAVSLTTPADAPFLATPTTQSEECVRDTEYMRFSHMTLLATARDGAIREGHRGDIGLSRLKAATPANGGEGDNRAYCSDCHTSREDFCNQCHTAVNLNLDCFSCHEYE